MDDAKPSVALATPFKPKESLLPLGGGSRIPKLPMEVVSDPVKVRPSDFRTRLRTGKVQPGYLTPRIFQKGTSKVTSRHQPPDPIADYVYKCAGDKRLKGLMANNNKGNKENRPWAAGWSTRAQEPGNPLAPQPRIRFPAKLDGANIHAHNQATRAESELGCSSSQDGTKWLLCHGPDAKLLKPFPPPLARVPEEHRIKQDETRRKQAEYTRERDSYLRQYKAQQQSNQEEVKRDDEETRKRLMTIKKAQAGMIKSELRLRRIASGRATVRQGQEMKQFRCPSTGVFWSQPPELKPRMVVSKEEDEDEDAQELAATDMLDMTEMV